MKRKNLFKSAFLIAMLFVIPCKMSSSVTASTVYLDTNAINEKSLYPLVNIFALDIIGAKAKKEPNSKFWFGPGSAASTALGNETVTALAILGNSIRQFIIDMHLAEVDLCQLSDVIASDQVSLPADIGNLWKKVNCENTGITNLPEPPENLQLIRAKAVEEADQLVNAVHFVTRDKTSLAPAGLAGLAFDIASTTLFDAARGTAFLALIADAYVGNYGVLDVSKAGPITIYGFAKYLDNLHSSREQLRKGITAQKAASPQQQNSFIILK